MRWASLVVVVALATSADARRGHGPSIAAIAVTATQQPEVAKAQLAQKTKDPNLAGADRVIGRDQPGYVAFTFDDGPNPQTTPVVIDALQKYDIPATFFIVTWHFIHGKDEPRAQARALLAKEVSLGYMIGNHTVHHARLQTASEKKLVTEVDSAFTTLAALVGKPIALFRAPYGKLNARARAHLHELGVTDVYWSIDSRDWETAEEDSAELRQNIFRAIVHENGGVVLMHDTRKVTAKIVNDVLDDLEAENCRRLTANETPIWPVSLHYFLRDGGQPRAIPDDIQKQTAAYQKALPDRCALRASQIAKK